MVQMVPLVPADSNAAAINGTDGKLLKLVMVPMQLLSMAKMVPKAGDKTVLDGKDA